MTKEDPIMRSLSHDYEAARLGERVAYNRCLITGQTGRTSRRV